MYRVFYYRDRNGRSPVADYLRGLASRTDKDSRIKLNKINDYIEYLEREGKNAGEPYIKRLEGEIWELRPLRDRILFAAWDGRRFILLHHFMKETRKAPQGEIGRAKRNLADYRERNDIDD